MFLKVYTHFFRWLSEKVSEKAGKDPFWILQVPIPLSDFYVIYKWM
ncbi:hypothetical protein SAG0122_04900 [Streptococcus agalactiae STIR-CD-09]|nr:hypothetical protein SAG0122_04900 [Streptococcus agalactiae STIR-CD-09]